MPKFKWQYNTKNKHILLHQLEYIPFSYHVNMIRMSAINKLDQIWSIMLLKQLYHRNGLSILDMCWIPVGNLSLEDPMEMLAWPEGKL